MCVFGSEQGASLKLGHYGHVEIVFCCNNRFYLRSRGTVICFRDSVKRFSRYLPYSLGVMARWNLWDIILNKGV